MQFFPAGLPWAPKPWRRLSLSLPSPCVDTRCANELKICVRSSCDVILCKIRLQYAPAAVG